MKKRVVKLTESDLERLVKRIIKEDYDQEMNHDQEEMNDVWRMLNRLGDKNEEIFDMMEKTFNEDSMSVEQFVSNLPTHFGFDEEYLISIIKQIQKEGI